MKTERKLFESNEFVKTIIHRYEWSDEFNNYQIKDCVINGSVFDFIEAEKDQPLLNGAWFGWQASAQRQGYKLVPLETLEEALSWANCASSESWSNEQREEIDKHYGVIEKAIIGACDDYT